MIDIMKVGDVVRIKPEWCDGEIDRNAFHIVVEDYGIGRCRIGLIDPAKYGFPLGITEVVSYKCIEVV